MKTLKFAPDLVAKILAGEKTSTWRLFDDKDLHEGDTLMFVNKETFEEFGTATITSLHTRTLGTLTDTDWEGHERFQSEEEMYKTYRMYYGEKVTQDTEVKILSFKFIQKPG
ncbi:MAG: ASCH domain-containing protein [Candidatus Pacebacteria bacterium]|nr:ASCH domain-containing protein [Candidatus Paceibacterota bacterium]